MEVEFRLLGPLEICAGDVLADPGEPRRRAVLAALLVDADTVVPPATLIDRVWGDDPPARADRTLSTHVSRLRRTLQQLDGAEAGSVAIVKQQGGYRLAVERRQIDLFQFRNLVSTAAGTVGDAQRVALLRQAVALWRGQPLVGVPGDWAQRLRERYLREYLEATVAWAEAELRVDNPKVVLGVLTELADDHPLVEPLTVTLVRALVAAGRPSEALERCRQHRERLADEQGTDQCAELRTLYEAILRDEVEPSHPGSSAPSISDPPDQPAAEPSSLEAERTPLPAGPTNSEAERASLLAGPTDLKAEGASPPAAPMDLKVEVASPPAAPMDLEVEAVWPPAKRHFAGRVRWIVAGAVAAAVLLAVPAFGTWRGGGGEPTHVVASSSIGSSTSVPVQQDRMTTKLRYKRVFGPSLGATASGEQWASAHVSGLAGPDATVGFRLLVSGQPDANLDPDHHAHPLVYGIGVAINRHHWQILSVGGEDDFDEDATLPPEGDLRISVTESGLLTLTYAEFVLNRQLTRSYPGRSIFPFIYRDKSADTVLTDIRSNARTPSVSSPLSGSS